MSNQIEFAVPARPDLVEVLDRVLDKGLFVGGDIKISLAEVELLTIRIRLIVCSLDKAREIGLDWWMYDRHLSPGRAARRRRGARSSVSRLSNGNSARSERRPPAAQARRGDGAGLGARAK